LENVAPSRANGIRGLTGLDSGGHGEASALGCSISLQSVSHVWSRPPALSFEILLCNCTE